MFDKSVFRKKSIEKVLQDIRDNEANAEHHMVKDLTVRDLTFLGIAAIIGASIFSAIGTAAANGGPAVSLLFVGTAISCMFTAYCYARFAATVPISGSAYTYAYTSFGEIVAWILGWNLLLEYAISNVAVAISWSGYFVTLINGLHIGDFHPHIPDYMTIDYLSAMRAAAAVVEDPSTGDAALLKGANAWQQAPQLFGFRIIANWPALLITVLITYLVYTGIRESKKTNNVLVVLKLGVILLVVLAGAFFVNPEYWYDFAPQGARGVLMSVAAVCFAYIGFDSVSTTAEECENPQRDIPRAMMYALGICTTLYVLITLILTGMVPYKELRGITDPLAYVFEKQGFNRLAGIIAASAVIALTSALLVYQLGQPRIWMSMARDGLLPKAFARIHPRYKTPSFATIMTGVIVGIPALFMNLTEVIDLSSIGTLFAFALVCGGVLMLDQDPKSKAQSKFQIPYFNAKFVSIFLLLITLGLIYRFNPGAYSWWANELLGQGQEFGQALIYLVFFGLWTLISWWSFTRNLSLIPVLGLTINLYLMTQMGTTNWIRFMYWCAVGFAIYFAYSYRRSRLHQA
jgi:basic amino acid/polyamine antiporter, APA family